MCGQCKETLEREMHKVRVRLQDILHVDLGFPHWRTLGADLKTGHGAGWKSQDNVGVLVLDPNREFSERGRLACMETCLQLFKSALCRLVERGLFAEDVMPGLFLGRRGLAGRFLDPFDRRCKSCMVLKGSDKIGLIKILGMDDPEEQWLKDMMPFSAHSSTSSQG